MQAKATFEEVSKYFDDVLARYGCCEEVGQWMNLEAAVEEFNATVFDVCGWTQNEFDGALCARIGNSVVV